MTGHILESTSMIVAHRPIKHGETMWYMREIIVSFAYSPDICGVVAKKHSLDGWMSTSKNPQLT